MGDIPGFEEPRRVAYGAGCSEYPLLPLQKTIAVQTEAVRRMAVNSEAHVVSYSYDGFGVQGTAALRQVGRLEGKLQGGVATCIWR